MMKEGNVGFHNLNMTIASYIPSVKNVNDSHK